MITTGRDHQKFLKNPLTAIRTTVMKGSVWCISSNTFVISGTTYVMRKNMIRQPITKIMPGYIMAVFTFERSSCCFSLKSASLSNTMLIAPEASPARTMLT